MEQGSGHFRDLPESLDLLAGARLGHLMEWNGSLSCRSGRSSDVSKAADESTVVGFLRRDTTGGSHLLQKLGWRLSIGEVR